MIQGLRLLPFTADLPIFNCDTCQNGSKKMNLQAQPIEVRRRQGCGFLPLASSSDTSFGIPDGVDLGADEEGRPVKPLHCAGYLTSLPEVAEAVQIRPQWLKGGPAGVREYIGHECADLGPALNAQAILDGAVQTKQNHETEKRAKEAEEARRHGG